MKHFTSLLLLGSLAYQLIGCHGLQSAANVTELLETNFLTREFRAKCRHQGGVASEQKLKSSLPTIGGCIAPQIDIERLLEDLGRIRNASGTGAVFKKYCRDIIEVVKCSKDVVKELIQTCFDEEEGRVVYIGLKIVSRILNYACTDSFTDYLSERGAVCIESSIRQVTDCVDSRIEHNKQIYPEKFLQIVFNERECHHIDVLLECSAKAWKDCDQAKNRKRIDGLMQVIRNPIPCDFTPPRG